MGYVGNEPSVNFTSFAKQDLTGVTGSPVKRGFTLTYAVANANEIEVFVNNVRQEPTEAYTVSGTALTMTGDVETTDDFYIIYLGKALQTTTPPDGSVSTAKIADSAVDLTSKVTGTLPVANGGTGLSSGFVNGITGLDQFRLTADTTNGFNGDITSNIERVDDATFAKIGTGMTESSGIFTFPETGLWQVICNPGVIGVSDNRNSVVTNVSSDSGSNYDEVADASGGGGASSFDLNNVYSNAFVNVTNASTFRVKFTATSFGVSCRIIGDTNKTRTSFSFIRLGGSQ